jgi:hypothetical protein
VTTPDGIDEETTPRPQRSARLIFCTTVLASEAFIVFFATLVAYGLRLAEPATVWAVGGGAALLCLVAAALQRSRVGIAAGSVLQVGLIASGVVLSMMYVVGVLFAALWVIGLVLGNRIDSERAERAAAEPGAARQ